MHAVIHPQARLAAGALVGPFSMVGEHVSLGRNVVLGAHVVVLGRTEIGAETRIHSFACLGDAPQHKRTLANTCMTVGERCVIREHVTVHCGTLQPTRIGNQVWLLAGSHVGHDCDVGDFAVVSNACQLAGHVRLGRHANVGGMCGVQQFSVIGDGAMVGGGSMVDRHVPPYSLVVGNRAQFRGINIRGLKRRQVPQKQISSLVQCAKRIYSTTGGGAGGDAVHQRAERVLQELVQQVEDEAVLARHFAQFICDAGRVTPTWCARRASMGVVT